MQHREIYEVLKEYYAHIAGMDDLLQGYVCRITLTDDDSYVRYTYGASHAFIPAEGGEYFYEPRAVYTLETAETELLMYMRHFTVEFGEPEVNKFYFRNRLTGKHTSINT